MFNRRDMLSGLAVISMTSVAGCSQSFDPSTLGGENSSNSQAAQNTARQFFTGLVEGDAEKVNDNLHPDHPSHPIDANEGAGTNPNDVTIDSVETSSIENVLESQRISSEQETENADSIASKLSNKISESGYSDHYLIKAEISSEQTDSAYALAVKDQGTWYVRVFTARRILQYVRQPTSELEPEEAEQTGEETTAEVSDKVQIRSVVGDATSDGEKIEVLNASLRLAAGSDPVDLSQVSYTIETPVSKTSVSGDPDEVNGLSYRREQSIENDSTTLSEQEDLIVAELDLSNIDGADPIQNNTDFKLLINSPSVSQSSMPLGTPRNIIEGESYIL